MAARKKVSSQTYKSKSVRGSGKGLTYGPKKSRLTETIGRAKGKNALSTWKGSEGPKRSTPRKKTKVQERLRKRSR